MEPTPDYSKIAPGFFVNRGESSPNQKRSLFIQTERPLGEIGIRMLKELGINASPQTSIYTTELTLEQVLALSTEPWVFRFTPSHRLRLQPS